MLPAKTKAQSTGQNSVLKKLYVNELKTIYWVEKQMLKLLPGLRRAATTRYLKASFTGHLLATQDHVKRIEEVFNLLNEKRATKKCSIINDIISEAKSRIKSTKKNTQPRDLELLSTAQKFEHYEINVYRKLMRLAGVYGHQKIEAILKETLIEEEEAQETFIAIENDTLMDELFKVDDELAEDECEAAEEE